MAHFAEIDENNIVTRVIVISNTELLDENGDEVESLGINFIKNTLGLSGTWLKTSYNTYGNQAQTYDDRNGITSNISTGTPLRGNFAGPGFIYDPTNDVFYPPSPGVGFSLNTNTWLWESD